MSPSVQRLLSMLKAGPLERRQIMARLGSRSTTQHTLSDAVKAGLVEKVEQMYQLRSEGQNNGTSL